MKLIDKDALAANVCNMQDAYISKLESRGMMHDDAVMCSVSYVNGIRDTLDSLEVKEGDSMQDSPSLTKENSTPLSGGGKGDLVQEESVSDVWHNASEKPEHEDLLIETNDGRIIHRQSINNYGMVKRWAYTSDLLNLDNSCNFGKNWKEPVSNPIDFEQELYKVFGQVKDFTLGMRIAKRFYDMGKNSQEPVSEDLEQAAKNHAVERYRVTRDMVLAEKCKWSFQTGAKWQKENLWKPADGDDLPEIDREVIALLDNGKVVFAHRPPEYWDGKDIVTGKVTRNYPKTYGKGGWNIPDVKYWLNVVLPKEIELWTEKK